MNSTDVIARDFWEFRRLLKLAYVMGYKFGGKKQHTALGLWVGWRDVHGLAFYEEDMRLKYIDRWCDIDWITVDEFYLTLTGAI